MSLMNAWASTLPGAGPFMPHIGDECLVAECTEIFVEHEEVYYVTELPESEGRWQPVCWRHISRGGLAPYPVNHDDDC